MAQTISNSADNLDWRTEKKWYTHETLMLRITQTVLRLYYYPKVRIEKIGFENIPSGAAILVANHVSNDDPPLMGITFPNGRYIYPMAKKELFETPKSEWFFRHIGCFPINRGGGFDQWAFEHVGRILAAGQLCTIYAEGSRSGRENVELRRAKIGAARLAAHYKVPILPCGIIGHEKLHTAAAKGWRKVLVRIAVGKPIDVASQVPEDMSDTKLSTKIYREITDTVMRAVASLLPEENRGYYA